MMLNRSTQFRGLVPCGERIRRAIAEHAMTLDEFAVRARLSRRVVTKLVQSRAVDVRTLRKAAAALGVDVRRLVISQREGYTTGSRSTSEVFYED